jgi:DNA-binding response OmpR family regulator
MQKICLIAAHDPWFIQLLKIYSEEFGFGVVQAFDAQEVIGKALHEHPAIIFLQLDLPGSIKGSDMLKMLRLDAQTKQIPVFVFSWQGSQEEVVEGATAHLVEPITYEIFVDALQAAGLGERGAGRPAQPLNPGTLPRTGNLQRRRISK